MAERRVVPRWFQPCTYQVKNRFQSLPFKCNVHRCIEGLFRRDATLALANEPDTEWGEAGDLKRERASNIGVGVALFIALFYSQNTVH
jgi:hypothetical protein